MKEFIKRVLPFFLTFIVGILIASLFVPIFAPRFKSSKRSWKHREYKRVKCENYKLRRQLEELKKENTELKEDLDFSNRPFSTEFSVEPLPAK